MWSGPSSSPACGTDASLARRAILNAEDHFGRDAPAFVVRQPETDDLAGAVTRMLGGEAGECTRVEGVRLMREAATIIATSTPVAFDAWVASSRTISRAGVIPPTNGAYEVGSI